MRIQIIALIAALPLANALAAEDAPRTVSVNGYAELTAEPDRARIQMSVEERAPELRAARDAVVDVTRRFLAFCKTLKIDERRISTTGLNINPVYVQDRTRQDGSMKLEGYIVSRELQVELHDLEKIGELIEGAVDAGANRVSPPFLYSSKQRQLHRDALAAAARDARANAEVLAGAMGVRVGEPMQISADGGIPYPKPMQMRGRAEMFGADMAAAETYSIADISISANVNATFELKTPE